MCFSDWVGVRGGGGTVRDVCFKSTSGMRMCVWSISWYQHYQVCFLLLSWQVFRLVLSPGTVFPSECTWLLPHVKSPTCVSTNSSPSVTTHPPYCSAPLPLIKNTQGHIFPPVLSSSSRPSSCSLQLLRSAVSRIITTQPFKLCMTVHTCGCANVRARGDEHETAV